MADYMLRVAVRTCQYRTERDNKIVTADAGTIHTVPSDHPHFRDVGSDMDFNKSSEEELLRADVDFDELVTFAFEEYGVVLEFHPGMTRLEKITKFVNIRSREINVESLARMPG